MSVKVTTVAVIIFTVVNAIYYILLI